MEDIPEVYQLETIEQVRAIADELRVSITEALGQHAMTVTQLGAQLSEPPAKIHYHVRELERVGLVKLVETREKGGILEKYYRTVAKGFHVPGTILKSIPPDESIAVATEYLQTLSQGFLRTLAYALERGIFEGDEAPGLSASPPDTSGRPARSSRRSVSASAR